MSAVSMLTKVVNMDLFCFDITERIFESNTDLILRFLDGCISYCCTAQLTNKFLNTAKYKGFNVSGQRNSPFAGLFLNHCEVLLKKGILKAVLQLY